MKKFWATALATAALVACIEAPEVGASSDNVFRQSLEEEEAVLLVSIECGIYGLGDTRGQCHACAADETHSLLKKGLISPHQVAPVVNAVVQEVCPLVPFACEVPEFLSGDDDVHCTCSDGTVLDFCGVSLACGDSGICEELCRECGGVALFACERNDCD